MPYVMTFTGGWESFSPLDSTDYYIGADPFNSSMAGASTVLNISVGAPFDGTITGVWIKVRIQAAGGVGSNEAVVHALNINGADTALGNMAYNTQNNEMNVVLGAPVAIAQGDDVAIKVSTPAWVTNPSGVKWYCTVLVE